MTAVDSKCVLFCPTFLEIQLKFALHLHRNPPIVGFVFATGLFNQDIIIRCQMVKRLRSLGHRQRILLLFETQQSETFEEMIFTDNREAKELVLPL